MASLCSYLCPRDVINLSECNKELHTMCHNDTIVKQLLDNHFPSSYYTDTPWSQLVALDSKVYSFYEISIDGGLGFCEVSNLKIVKYHSSKTHDPSNPYFEDLEEYAVDLIGDDYDYPDTGRLGYIWVPGLKVEGVSLNVCFMEAECYQGVLTDKTKEGLAKQMVEDSYDANLEDLMHSYHGDGSEFCDYLRNYETHNKRRIPECCIPFTKEGYFEMVMTHDVIDSYRNSNTDVIFRDVLF